MKKIFYVYMLSVCLMGCATTQYYEFKVSAQSVTHGTPGKKFCKVYYTNEDEWKIDGQKYTQLTESLLKEKGIIILHGDDERKADCVVTVTHKTNLGKEQQIGYTYGQTGVSGSSSQTTYGYGQSTTRTIYTPTYGVTGTYTHEIPRAYIGFHMSAINAETKKEMWNIGVYRNGDIHEKFIDIFPLFECILSHYLFQNDEVQLLFTQEEINQVFQHQCGILSWP